MNYSKKSPPPTPRRIVRIRLGATASQALDEVGLPAFGVCGCERTADGTGAWILYLAETRHPRAQECIAIMRNAAELEKKTV
jgi:hypothetical protein